MSLNKRLLILRKGKPDYSRMTPFFSGLNATEKCKCNETFKKKGGFPHSQSFYVCMERMQSRIST